MYETKVKAAAAAPGPRGYIQDEDKGKERNHVGGYLISHVWSLDKPRRWLFDKGHVSGPFGPRGWPFDLARSGYWRSGSYSAFTIARNNFIPPLVT